MEQAHRQIVDLLHLLNEREQLLQALPRCPCPRAQCVPHALEWITQARQGLQPVEQPAPSLEAFDRAMSSSASFEELLKCRRL